MNPTTTVPRLFHKKDTLFLCCILALAVALGSLFFFGKQGTAATVRMDGKTVQTLRLTDDRQYSFQNNGYALTVQVKNGKVGIADPTCKDKLCQNTGFIDAKGASIVCLPAGISVTVEGASQQDAVTY